MLAALPHPEYDMLSYVSPLSLKVLNTSTLESRERLYIVPWVTLERFSLARAWEAPCDGTLGSLGPCYSHGQSDVLSLAILEAVASKGYRSHNRLYSLAQASGSGHLSPTARAYLPSDVEPVLEKPSQRSRM